MLSTRLVALIALTRAVAGVATFKWPDYQLDYVDNVLWGNTNFLPALVLNCAPRENTTIAAQWVRIAYHDMATHDADDGTGGLDASIVYELDRARNVGEGMAQSLTDFEFFTSAKAGMADVIAMGTVLAVAGCGGPLIPYRAGRIDATGPGPDTVPLPEETLASHIESFRRQGFTPTEMITLVACGHSLGGVRQVDFPQIVPANAPNGFANFTPKVGFDNDIITQYLAGTTEDVLVVGTNTTTNSDLRIFSSDGNSTMKSLASPDAFSTTCGQLLERMINTVPNSVTLTDVVDPIDTKVSGVQVFPQNGSLILNANLRFIQSNPSRTVTMFWNGRTGSACSANECSVQQSSSSSTTPTFLAEKRGITSFTHYHFSAKIDLNSSISSFWFEVNENDGSAVSKVDNGGGNYVIEQDTVLFDAARSSTGSVGSDSFYEMVVAVKDTTSSVQISAKTFQPATIPIIGTVGFQPDPNHAPADGYTFYTANASTSVTSIDLTAVVDGVEFAFYVDANDFVIF